MFGIVLLAKSEVKPPSLIQQPYNMVAPIPIKGAPLSTDVDCNHHRHLHQHLHHHHHNYQGSQKLKKDKRISEGSEEPKLQITHKENEVTPDKSETK
jgi:hypothetical protein